MIWTSGLNEVSRLFDAAFTGTDGKANGQTGSLPKWVPATDIAEDESRIMLTLEVPGVKPDQVKIEVDKNRLTIKGEKEHRTVNEKGRVQSFERVYGSFQRSFTLPETVNTDAIEATVENGVLTVTLPKAEKAKPREITVRAS